MEQPDFKDESVEIIEANTPDEAIEKWVEVEECSEAHLRRGKDGKGWSCYYPIYCELQPIDTFKYYFNFTERSLKATILSDRVETSFHYPNEGDTTGIKMAVAREFLESLGLYGYEIKKREKNNKSIMTFLGGIEYERVAPSDVIDYVKKNNISISVSE